MSDIGPCIKTLPVHFSNEFGVVELVPVMEFMTISNINKTHPMVQQNSFDLETAEKIALITENKGIQICCILELNTAYLVLHNSSSTAAICKVIIKSFLSTEKPSEILNRLNRGK
jgi:hypothetical protein